MTIATYGLDCMNPLFCRVRATKYETKAPHMNTSPWAKLIIRRIP